MIQQKLVAPTVVFPIRTFRAGIAAMLLLLVVSTFLTWRVGENIKAVMHSQIDVLSAAQRVDHYGTVLEMSVRAVVAHGDKEAAAKYRMVQPELRRTLAELRSDLQLKENRIAAAEVDRADLALIALEYEALELASGGDLQSARAVINSPKYDYLLNTYFEGIRGIEGRAQRYVEETKSRVDGYLWVIIALSAASLSLVVMGWFSLVRPARTWGAQLDVARATAEAAAYELHEKQHELQASNDRLFKQARIDALTGLSTRLKFNEDVHSRWLTVDPAPYEYYAMMCDIDYFKQYNDTCGHLAGDTALALVAGALRSGNPEDETYRLGGEEFLIITKAASANAALATAERLRAAVEALGVPHSGSKVGVVTVSMGVAGLAWSGEMKAERWLRQADKALYQAKGTGRNKVVGSAEAAAA